MASSKVMASSSTSSTNPDLVRQSSTYSQLTIGDLQSDPSKNFGSMSMDELIRNIYGDNPPPPPSSDMMIIPTPPPAGGVTSTAPSLPRQGSFPPLPRDVASKTVDEVWKEISGGSSSNNNNNNNNNININGDGNMIRDDVGEEEEEEAAGGGAAAFNEMTLEEFLTKAGAVGEEDMKIPQMVGPVHGFVVDPALDARYPPQHQGESAAAAASGSGAILWLGNGGDRAGGGRGKRRAVLEPIDKVAQQRQRRMIKNRESAARSRERKQAYTVELESLVTQLEEENARLQREQVERNRERYKQLMENLIPVEEKRKPQTRQVLRRASSTHW